MKRLFLTWACILSVAAMQAQSLALNGNLAARDGSGNWYQVTYWYADKPEGGRQTREFLGKEYYVIGCISRVVSADWYVNYLSRPNGDLGPRTTLYMRQEDGRTYRFNEETAQEELVMDITLDKGDEFSRPDGERLVVESVADEGGVKVLYLKGAKKDDIWRSDIGSVFSGILPSDALPNLKLERITYDSKQDYVADVNEEYLKTATYSYQPTDQPTSSIWGRSFGELKYVFEDDVLHVTGRAVGWNCNDYVVECLIDNENNVYLALRGLLASRVSDYLSEVDVKFSGFKAGEYTVYGQAMAPVTLECKAMGNDDEATAIESVEAAKTVDATAIYDLAGRRLDREPEKGMYVKDGRKYLKR